MTETLRPVIRGGPHIFRCSSCGQLNRLKPIRTGVPICGSCKLALDTSGAPQEVDSKAMRSTIARSPVPVLVDFWAPWCGPCRTASPMIDKLARERAGRLLVLKANTQEHPDTAAPFGIQGIPTFMMFGGGQELDRQVGLPSPAQLASWIDQRLETSS